jgi:hypothetical protein
MPLRLTSQFRAMIRVSYRLVSRRVGVGGSGTFQIVDLGIGLITRTCRSDERLTRFDEAVFADCGKSAEVAVRGDVSNP